jgi:hypothetical protein
VAVLTSRPGSAGARSKIFGEPGLIRIGVLDVSAPAFDRSVPSLGLSIRIPPDRREGNEGGMEVEVRPSLVMLEQGSAFLPALWVGMD